MSLVSDWLATNGLTLENMTDIVLTSGRKTCEVATFSIKDVSVTWQSAIKYLGIVLDARKSFVDI